MTAWRKCEQSIKSNKPILYDDASVYGDFVLARNAKDPHTIWPLEIFYKTETDHYRLGIGGLDAHEAGLKALVEYLDEMKVGTKEAPNDTPVKKSHRKEQNSLHTDPINAYGIYKKEDFNGAETLLDLKKALQEKIEHFKLLEHIYAGAQTYKDEVLRQWIDNLTQFVNHPEYRDEALRRIDYIETKLLRSGTGA